MYNYTDAGGPDFQACTPDNKNILPDDQMAFGTVPIEVPANDPYLSRYNIGCLDFVRSQPIFRNDCKFSGAEFVRLFYVAEKNMINYTFDAFNLRVIHERTG